MEIIPITIEQQELVIDETYRFIADAEAMFQRHFELLPVLFDLKGQAAGMYKVSGRRRAQRVVIGGASRPVQRVIRYNPWVFAKYWQENFSTTIPHEVAHYIVDQIYGKVRPHGREWQALMDKFGADSSRTVDFDMSGIPTRTMNTMDYRCQCRTHQLSMRRHNRVLREGASYLCRFCNGELQLVCNEVLMPV